MLPHRPALLHGPVPATSAPISGVRHIRGLQPPTHQCVPRTIKHAVSTMSTMLRADTYPEPPLSTVSSDREMTGDIGDEATPRGTRAAKACRRCHRKKLRCFGGHPCSSCKKAHQSCDFGEGSANGLTGGNGVETVVKDDFDKRFKDLESLVHSILDRVTPQPARTYSEAAPASNNQFLSTYMPSPSQSCLLAADDGINLASFSTGNAELLRNPAGLDLRRLSPTTHGSSRNILSIAETMADNALGDYLAPSRSPPTPSSMSHTRNRNQGSAEGRLALLAQVGSRYSAPLRPLSFQPAHWENADHTRPPSPARDGDEHKLSQDFWHTMEVRPSLRDDPLSLGWIDKATANSLVSL